MNTNDLFTEMKRHYDATRKHRASLDARYHQAWGFYRGEMPVIKRKGDLPARKVLWESFESIYPGMVALFSDTQRAPVAFDSSAFNNTRIANAVTKALHDAALRMDDYYTKLMLALKELLITGNQMAAVGYDTKHHETDPVTFDNSPLEMLIVHTQAIQAAGYSIEHSLEFDEENKTVTGSIKGVRDTKHPVINLIPWRNAFLHPRATSTADAEYCGYAEQITIAEAKRRKYPQEAIERAGKVTPSQGAGTDTGLLVVDNMNAEAEESNDFSTLATDNNVITVFHHYWRGCYNTKHEELWHVVTTDAAYVEHEKVAYCPLVWGGMSIVPDSAFSESLYDYAKSTQISSTRARRAIQRSADNAAYPELEIQDDMVKAEGKAALNQRGPGSVYKVKAPNVIRKLPTEDVPNAMQLLNAEINQDAENVKQGSAGQAQALEKNAQASGVAVALTQSKQELNENQIAKCIAETFIKPIYRILLLVLQEMGNTATIEGQQLPFSAIRSDIAMSVTVEDAYTRANAATNVMNAYSAATQAGIAPANFQPENVYNIFADYLRAITGNEDVSRYITPPEMMPKPSPLQQKVQAVLAAAQLRNAIAETRLAEAKAEDMTADTQKKYNAAAKDLALIEEIATGIERDKIELMLKIHEEREQDKQQALENTDVVKDKMEEVEA